MLHHRLPLSCIAMIVSLLLSPLCRAQTSNGTRTGVVVLDGTVARVWQDTDDSSGARLVELVIDQSAIRRPVQASRIPAPGDVVYVHVGSTRGSIPSARQAIRCYVVPGENGTWQTATGDWFESANAESSATPTPGGSPANLPNAADASVFVTAWGLTCQRIQVGSRIALRVTQVEPDGRAAQAGLEVGDVIVALNGQAVDVSLLQGKLAGEMEISVVDINSGRMAQIRVSSAGDSTVTPSPPPSATKPTTETPSSETPAPSPAAEGNNNMALGISAEPVAIGMRSALKVLHVKPQSPAAAAGIEVGDILVKANGVALTRPEHLAAALRKTGPVLTLTVRDVRTGKDVPVEVKLSATSPTPPSPNPRTPTPTHSASQSRLGVVTELAFHDNEAAVKISEVEPSSPAAKAGLRAGTLIIRADNQPILHPNDLLDAERRAGKQIALRLVDAQTGRESSVTVPLP